MLLSPNTYGCMSADRTIEVCEIPVESGPRMSLRQGGAYASDRQLFRPTRGLRFSPRIQLLDTNCSSTAGTAPEGRSHLSLRQPSDRLEQSRKDSEGVCFSTELWRRTGCDARRPGGRATALRCPPEDPRRLARRRVRRDR